MTVARAWGDALPRNHDRRHPKPVRCLITETPATCLVAVNFNLVQPPNVSRDSLNELRMFGSLKGFEEGLLGLLPVKIR